MSLCRIAIIGFAVLWVLAAVVLAIGTFGWFEQEKDPLSGVFLIPIGLPWNRIGEVLGVPGPIAGIFAPGVNLLILSLICRLIRTRS